MCDLKKFLRMMNHLIILQKTLEGSKFPQEIKKAKLQRQESNKNDVTGL